MDTSEPSSPPARGERLNRFLARAGVGSRRRADELIAAGRVTINGVRVEKMATFVDLEHDHVAVDGRPMIPPSIEPVWIAFNKTAGILTTRRDTRGRATVFDGLPSAFGHLIPVGRLDMDTDGIILLTNDGAGANRLMHPRYEISRIYEAVVDGTPTSEQLHRLRDGIDLGDPAPARARAKIVTRHRTGAVVQVELHEGRNREVKRLFEAINHPVLRLRRLSFAGITASGLSPGQWRHLTPSEVARLTGGASAGD